MDRNIEETLASYLSERWNDDRLQIRRMSELSSGWSRSTYALSVSSKDVNGNFILQVQKKKSVVLSSSVEHDYRVLKAIENTGALAPKPYVLELNPDILGGPFIITSKDPGTTFNPFDRKGQLALRSHWERKTGLAEDVVDNLINIHNVPLEKACFLEKAPSAEATGPFEIDRCRNIAKEIGVERDPFVYFILDWLQENCPDSGYLTLIHGDFHIRNVLIDNDRVSSILDWELTRVSNPLFDLAYMCIPYLSGKVFLPGAPYACGVIPKEELIAQYERKTNRKINPKHFKFWRVLSALSLLLIIETGVSAYARKQTDEIRVAWLRLIIPVLHEDILSVLKENVPEYSENGSR